MSNLKQARIFDLNLFTGSSELIRQELKGIHYSLNGLAFQDVASDGNQIGFIDSYEKIAGTDSTSSAPMPFSKFSVRFLGGDNVDIRSDEEWAKYFIGGTFSEREFTGIFNNNVYADHFINDSLLPYTPSETALLNGTITPSLVLTTEYYQDYRRYQNYIQTLDSELMIPNYYLLDPDSFAVSLPDDSYPQYQYPDIKEYLNNTFVNEDKDLEDSLDKKNLFIINPIRLVSKNDHSKRTNSNYLRSEADLSKIYSLMPFANKLEIGSELASVNSGILFGQAIENNKYEFKFLKILKETFQEENNLQPASVNFGLNITQASGSGNNSYETVETTQTLPLRVLDVPTMMLYSFNNYLSETNDITALDPDGNEDQINIFSDTEGTYRYLSTDKTLDVFNAFREIIKTNFDAVVSDSLEFEDFLNQANETKYHETLAFRIQKIGGAPTGDSLTENTIQNIWFCNKRRAIKYIDTQVKYGAEYTYKIFSYVLIQGYKYRLSDLAVSRRLSADTDTAATLPLYCLEMRDPYTGENVAQRGLSQALLPSREHDAAFTAAADAAAAYTAAKTAALVATAAARAADAAWRAALTAAATATGAFAATLAAATLAAADRRRSRTADAAQAATTTRDDLRAAWTAAAALVLATPDMRVNDLFSDSQVLTTKPYVSELDISIESSVKIVEIPLEEKRMRITDHPPNDLVVSPYHLKDQSNRLAFYMKYDTFSPDTVDYPNALNDGDRANEISYKAGKDFASISKTKEETVSSPRFVEVYRTSDKPTSYQSFSGNLRKTIDLRGATGDITSDHFFIERVKENKKYYYAFRIRNENGVTGQLSPIFESELINDGGYTYGLFNQLSESELVEPRTSAPLLSVKKLINVIPNIQHLQLNTNDADFSDSSVSQLGSIELGAAAEETIWDQKFKIRLTSKKTGRKIDLNLKFEKKVSK